MKIVWLLMVCLLQIHAVSRDMLLGKWIAVTENKNTTGMLTIEKEYLHLNANKSFSIVLLVSVQNGDAYIKDLRIEGSGIWKRRDDTLVIYIQKVEVPFAKEIYLISQESLRNLANNFKYKYENEPLKIIVIEYLDNQKLVTENEKGQVTSYSRQ